MEQLGLLEQKDGYAVGIIGATGLVGERLRADLPRLGFPVDWRHSRLFASAKSAGQTLDWGGHEYTLQVGSTAPDFEGLDIVFSSAGGDVTKTKVSKEVVPHIVEAGALVIDNTSYWRMDEGVPLVVSEVNPEDLENIPKNIVANPNCTTMIAMTALSRLHEYAGLARLNVTSMQSVSGQGRAGIKELVEQTKEWLKDTEALLDGRACQNLPKPKNFPTAVAFNVAPLAGELVGRDTSEELKLVNESRKILGLAELAVQATCFRVPVVNVHTLSISASFEDRITPEQAEAILADAPGVELVDVPQPLHATGRDEVLVGRVRADASRPDENALQFVTAGDNVEKGASLNSVQLAKLLIQK